MSSVPHAPTSWQEDLEADLAYYRRMFGYRWRRLDHHLRAENVQEATAQVCLVYESQWRRHGKRTETRFDIFRYVAARVSRGRSCLRGSKNAGTLDWAPLRKTGPQREEDQLTIGEALRRKQARTEFPLGFRLDVVEWLATLPDHLRPILEDYSAGHTTARIAGRRNLSETTVQRRRRQAAELFATCCG